MGTKCDWAVRAFIGIVLVVLAAGRVRAEASAASSPTAIAVDASVQYQTIQGFGAACSFWQKPSLPLYRRVAFQDLLAKDLGLTILRFEVNPRLQWEPDPQADTLDLDRFDFKALEVAGKLAQGMKEELGDELKVICSVWSPPPWMKSNNDTKHGGSLRPECYAHFAKYCAGLCLGFEKTYGVPIYAMSLQNELVFTEPYDSCVYSPEAIRDVTRLTGETFRKWKVRTKIMGNEDVGAGVYARYLQYLKPTLDGAGEYLDFLCIHGYAGDGKTPTTNRGNWLELRKGLNPAKRELWMTETSGQPPTWDGALDVALHIHEALVYGQCSAWVYWQLTCPPNAAKESLCINGKPSPKFYAAKHFFRFVRPGAVRVAAGPDDPTLDLSAYVHTKNKTITIVLINTGNQERPVRVTVPTPWPMGEFETYRSTEQEECVQAAPTPKQNDALTLSVPPRGIVTLFGKAQK